MFSACSAQLTTIAKVGLTAFRWLTPQGASCQSLETTAPTTAERTCMDSYPAAALGELLRLAEQATTAIGAVAATPTPQTVAAVPQIIATWIEVGAERLWAELQRGALASLQESKATGQDLEVIIATAAKIVSAMCDKVEGEVLFAATLEAQIFQWYLEESSRELGGKGKADDEETVAEGMRLPADEYLVLRNAYLCKPSITRVRQSQLSDH